MMSFMGSDIMQVCRNGHKITEHYVGYPSTTQDFCDECGESTLNSCENCKNPITGYSFHEGDTFGPMPMNPPQACKFCGNHFPWFKSRSGESNATVIIENLLSRFNLVVNQLKNRHENRDTLTIKDEYDLQDLLRSLLKINFDDIRPEEPTESHVSGSGRIDFLIKDETIGIEVKKTRVGLTDRKLADELIIDINRFEKHSKCKTLFCFIYDPDSKIKNPKSFQELKSERIKVKVIINPTG